jgi:hypothetical protein
MQSMGPHRSARTATTITIHMLALRTDITGQTTLSAACSLALGPGIADITGGDFMAAATTGIATTIATTDVAPTGAGIMADAVTVTTAGMVMVNALVTDRDMGTVEDREDLQTATEEAMVAAFAAAIAAADFMAVAGPAAVDTVDIAKTFSTT